MNILISGGGTGGHIFPAISIANEIRKRDDKAGILFIGAKDRMEMQRVPEAGYNIIGLPVSGFNRSSKFRNIGVMWRLLKSLLLAVKHIRGFKPNIVVGVGGYASGPTLWVASLLGIPIIIQEQNSIAGITNKILAKRAVKICVAYRGMNRFFPADKIVLTGNPVRPDLENACHKTDEALSYFGLQRNRPVLLVLGGSLGARSINNGVIKSLNVILKAGIQIIWQTGKIYYDSIKEELNDDKRDGLWISSFISRMDYAYGAADLVVSRAGAGTISELCLQCKPVILVPSPNVAEDHQTLNAKALADNQAAMLLPDNEASERLASTVLSIITDRNKLQTLSDNICLFAQHNSAERIVEVIERVTK